MTKGQQALNDLEIILDDAGLEHGEIIQGWINKIAAELTTNATLVKLAQLIEPMATDDKYGLARGIMPDDARKLVKQARAALALAKEEA